MLHVSPSCITCPCPFLSWSQLMLSGRAPLPKMDEDQGTPGPCRHAGDADHLSRCSAGHKQDTHSPFGYIQKGKPSQNHSAKPNFSCTVLCDPKRCDISRVIALDRSLGPVHYQQIHGHRVWHCWREICSPNWNTANYWLRASFELFLEYVGVQPPLILFFLILKYCWNCWSWWWKLGRKKKK